MTVWIGVIGTLLGALAGGGLALLNARFQFRQQVQRDRQKLLLSKLEELHDIVFLVSRSYQTSTVERMRNYLDIQVGSSNDEPKNTPSERLALLVAFYAPELNSAVARLNELRIDYAKIHDNAILDSSSDTPSKQNALMALQRANEKIYIACDDLQSQVVELSRKYL